MSRTPQSQGVRSATAVSLNWAATLSRSDTHRVVAVVEKAIERLEMLSLLNYETTGGGEDAPASATKVDDNNRGVGGILEEQKRLEQRYEALLVATQKVKNNPQDPTLDPMCYHHVGNDAERQLLDELRLVSQQLKDQSKMLCRQLKDNPNDGDNWRKIIGERSELITLLSQCTKELTTTSAPSDVMADGSPGGYTHSCSYEVFAKKVLNEQSASQWADDLVRKERETNQNVKHLQQEVKFERSAKEKELDERNQTLSELKTTLRKLKQEVKDSIEKMRAETEAGAEARQREAFDIQRKLRNQLMWLEEKMENERRVNEDVQRHLRSKLEKLEDLNGRWTEKNQEAQRLMEGKKHSMERTRTEQAEKLKDKLEQREIEARNQQEREEKQKAKKDGEERKQAQKKAEFVAATKLQASIKAFLTRQILTVQKKKMGKKRK